MVAQHYRWDFIGLSTDQKPTPATSEKVVDGSTFYCSDNSKLYVYCKNNWYERKPLGSGGGGTTYTAGTGIDITEDTISIDEEVVATLDELNARIAKGEGAPTTATEGVVGGLYEDNTNGKLYICTAITEGTDPDPDTYTWEEVGVGGGGVEGVTTLTADDYNYPSENPNTILLPLLPEGFYRVADNTVYVTEENRKANKADRLYYVSGKDYNGKCAVWRFFGLGNASAGYSTITAWEGNSITGGLTHLQNVLTVDYYLQYYSPLSGSSDPINGTTTGFTGQIYVNIASGTAFVCVNQATQTWKQITNA